jgi:hypothetical protein
VVQFYSARQVVHFCSGVYKTTIAKVTKTMLPFFLAMIIALMAITYLPKLSLWLPAKTNQLKAQEVEESVQAWNENIFGQKNDSK